MAVCLLIMHHSLTYPIKAAKNLHYGWPSVCKPENCTFPPHDSERGWRLAICCVFFFRQLLIFTDIWATEDRDVLGVGQLLEQGWVQTCDVISGTFLRLWQMRVFSLLSWPQHLQLQIRPPPLTLPRPHVLATVTFKVFHIWEAISPPLSSPFPPIPC